jgi:CO/xanthine dehydrogenase FAD-binding subunit
VAHRAWAPDEIVTAVRIPEAALAGRSAFAKLGARSQLVISIVMVAARLEIRHRTITRVALAVGTCSPVATRLPAVEAALACAPADASLGVRIRDAEISAAIAPIDDFRADAGYRAEAAATLLRRVVAALAEARP